MVNTGHQDQSVSKSVVFLGDYTTPNWAEATRPAAGHLLGECCTISCIFYPPSMVRHTYL